MLWLCFFSVVYRCYAGGVYSVVAHFLVDYVTLSALASCNSGCKPMSLLGNYYSTLCGNGLILTRYGRENVQGNVMKIELETFDVFLQRCNEPLQTPVSKHNNDDRLCCKIAPRQPQLSCGGLFSRGT